MNEKNANKNLNIIIDLFMVTTDTKPVPEESQIFTEAWNHPNTNSCKKWWEAIKKEFANMNKQQEWCKTKKSLMPSYWMCIKKPWDQFSENFSPVVNNIIFWVL